MLKLLFRASLAVLIVAIAGAALGLSGWRRMHAPYKGFSAGERFVEIPAGAGSGEIRRRLIDAGVIEDETVFRAALWWSGASRRLKAGEYRFDRPMTPLEVIDVLDRGDVYTERITFPEGLTIREMAAIFEARGFGSAAEFEAAAGDESLIADLDPDARDLEGYLFPDTYALPRRTAASAMIAVMVRRFREAYHEGLRDKAAAEQLTSRQVVTLASLIEKETGRADERPIVAAVYRNRMTIGMPMQADPTVVYALMKAGRYDGNIRRTDLQFDSPYNTYRYPGLPPGPIAAPGRGALEAVLAPADVKYLYFVSRNDGSHVFASTLAEHNANVQKYQVLFFRQGGRGQAERETRNRAGGGTRR